MRSQSFLHRWLLCLALLSTAFECAADETSDARHLRNDRFHDRTNPEVRNLDVATKDEFKEQKEGQREKIQPPRDLTDVIGYIIGGTQVSDNPDGTRRYPWMVSLQKWGGHFCGGALIAADIVLSAAHCQGIDGAKVGVLNKHETDKPTFSGLQLGTHIIPHPQYGSNYKNDIMVVKLTSTVDTTIYPPIEVNSDASDPSSSGDELVTMGWGQTIAGSSTSMPNTLREVSVYYVPQNTCKSAYGGYIKDDMMCASDTGEDACQGDSGGPLIREGTNALTDKLFGVVSWGYGCASASHPGVYSRTSTNYDWVRDTVCDESSAPPAYFNCPGASTPAPTPNPTPNPTPAPVTPAPAGTEAGTTPAPVTPEPTPDPTPEPTPEPTPDAADATLPISRSFVTICVQFDMFPADIAFWLENGDGTEVYLYRDNFNSDEMAFKEVQETVALNPEDVDEDREFRFVITDSYGDGFGMSQGDHPEGSFKLVWGEDCDITSEPDKLIFQGASNFGFFSDHYFHTTESGDFDSISIDLRLDDFPQDTGWTVECSNGTNSNTSDYVVVREKLPSAYTGLVGEEVSETVYIPSNLPGDCIVTITDSFGDGMCCTNGNGTATVYLGSSTNGTLVGSTTQVAIDASGDYPFSQYGIKVNRGTDPSACWVAGTACSRSCSDCCNGFTNLGANNKQCT